MFFLTPPLQVRCLKGQRGLSNPPSFDGIHIVNHYGDTESYHSSDDDALAKLPNPQGGGGGGGSDAGSVGGRITLHADLEDTDSDEDNESLRLTVPTNGSHKTTTV